MTTVAAVAISANVTGGPEGSWSLTPPAGTRSVGTAVFSEQIITLSAAANTITLPANISAAFIIPPNNSFPQLNPAFGGTLTLKGVTGDTGVPISSYFITALEFDTTNSPTSIVITSTATGTLKVTTV